MLSSECLYKVREDVAAYIIIMCEVCDFACFFSIAKGKSVIILVYNWSFITFSNAYNMACWSTHSDFVELLKSFHVGAALNT